jgi:CDP-4-dehydro-6-deoxyglucose reductase
VLLDDGGRRSFSIASPPHDAELIELHARYVPGGGFTERLFKDCARARCCASRAPSANSYIAAGTAPLILIAGGTGFAPVKSMLRHVLEHGVERQIHFYWGARRQEDLYEEALVLDWVRKYPQLQFSAVLSEAARRTPAGGSSGGCMRRCSPGIRT